MSSKYLILSITLFLFIAGCSSNNEKEESKSDTQQITSPLMEVEKIFIAKCAECYSLQVKSPAPNLRGLFERRSEEWVRKLLSDTQNMFENDPVAQQLLKEHEEYQMPDHQLSETETDGIMAFLKSISTKQ